MKEIFKNWLILVIGIAALTGIGYLIAGPSAAEVETAQAADLIDARAQAHAQAHHVAGLTRECHSMRGPTAELLQIRGTDNYVCREAEIEPTPVEVMQRYALLGGGK